MYKLGFISGYCRENTIEFSNTTAQKNYFDSHVNLTIDAYYPPHYTNTIKLSYNEYKNNNFVIIVYNNKYFYYFIDRVKYINEDIVEITIVMDTYQTYMFECKILTGELNRFTIPRWNYNNRINRDYIRENISENKFILEEIQNSNNEIFIAIIESKGVSTQNMKATSLRDLNGNLIPTGMYVHLYYIPRPEYYSTTEDCYQVNLDGTDRGGSSRDWFDNVLENALKGSLTQNIYLINTDAIKAYLNVSYNSTEEKIYITSRNLNMTVGAGGMDYWIHTIEYYKYWQDEPIKYNSNALSRNTSQNTQFDCKFIPQIIDENYMSIEYGERKAYARYPLSKMRTTTIRKESYYEFYEGIRGYHLRCNVDWSPDYNNIDEYDTWAINSLPISFNLLTDAWINYAATHKASLVQGRDLAYDQLLAKTGMKMATAGLTAGITDYTSDASKDTSKPLVSGVMAPWEYMLNSKFLDTKYKVHDDDLKNTPNTIGQGTSLLSDIINGCTNTVFRVLKVNDLEACFKYFELYGYKVKKFITNKGLNNLPKGRGYYNFYKFGSVTVEKIAGDVSNEIMLDIKNRLENGIRIFSRNVEISTSLNYDNYDITYGDAYNLWR